MSGIGPYLVGVAFWVFIAVAAVAGAWLGGGAGGQRADLYLAAGAMAGVGLMEDFAGIAVARRFGLQVVIGIAVAPLLLRGAGLSAGAIACGDFAGPLVTPVSGTHPVSTSGAAASTTMNTLGVIFNALDKPMQACLGAPLRLCCTSKDRFVHRSLTPCR